MLAGTAVSGGGHGPGGSGGGRSGGRRHRGQGAADHRDRGFPLLHGCTRRCRRGGDPRRRGSKWKVNAECKMQNEAVTCSLSFRFAPHRKGPL